MVHTRQQREKLNQARDAIMAGLGTFDKLIPDHTAFALTWRKPLSIPEVNRLAPTAEVRARPGRA